MSEAEYADWAFKQNFESEWVDGEVIVMAPISDIHDDLESWLHRLLAGYVEFHDLGKVKGSRFQMRLAHPSRREPDVSFIAKERLGLLKATYFDGPFDLAMEIVSPSSESRDWREKYLEYQSGGVKEYWIIDPHSQQIEAYVLGRDQSYQLIEETGGKITSTVVLGWYIKPGWLWQEPRMKVLAALFELGVRV
jgi:Uma2 family endonuclease